MDDETIGRKVREARERRGLSQAELGGKVGTSQQTIDKIERGEVTFSRYLEKICVQLGIDGTNRHVEVSTPVHPPPPLVGKRDLPVFASVEGGDGAVIVSSDPVDYVGRPEPLAQVRDGYAVLVTGDSMFPAYEAGDTVLVHPHLPPVRDCDVILYGHDRQGRDVVSIKRLVKVTATDWHLRQWNAPQGQKEFFTLPRKSWTKCHRIIGKYARR